jgi:hypothetical protein
LPGIAVFAAAPNENKLNQNQPQKEPVEITSQYILHGDVRSMFKKAKVEAFVGCLSL